MKNAIFDTVAVLGFFILVVSVAGVEQDAISALQLIMGFIVGLFMMLLPCHFGGFMSYQETKETIPKGGMQKKHGCLERCTRHVA